MERRCGADPGGDGAGRVASPFRSNLIEIRVPHPYRRRLATGERDRSAEVVADHNPVRRGGRRGTPSNLRRVQFRVATSYSQNLAVGKQCRCATRRLQE